MTGLYIALGVVVVLLLVLIPAAVKMISCSNQSGSNPDSVSG